MLARHVKSKPSIGNCVKRPTSLHLSHSSWELSVPLPLHSPRSTAFLPHRDLPSSSDLDDSECEEVRPGLAFDHNKSMLETLLAEGI